ncbi:MAG: hypothetical protein D6690_17005 [Nitrospirae bacterium]|nr:MAG: hypothetical protein D6690_17005 [Nitrospirota bacterium]
MRFAIWAAVSTEAQASGDKVSLAEQEQRCRVIANGKGWQETAGPYIVPGESRTRWVNLRDAEREIPQLRQMLDDAHDGRFNVLVLYDYNRLRELLDPVSRTLAHYGVQIYSVSQPIEPLPPERYSPYATDSAWMMQGLAQIISRAQISDLRRKYAYAMPRRVTQKGLQHQIPYGYRKPPGQEHNRDAIPEPDPHTSQAVRGMAERLLRGASIREIIAWLDEEGYPPPRGRQWWPQTVRAILSNPFYAGWVRFGVSRVRLDPRTGKRIRDYTGDNMVKARGRHQPLWDDDTHQQLLDELTRRGRRYRGIRANAFSHLVRCGVCGASMWRYQNGPRSVPDRLIWRCSNMGQCRNSVTDADLRVQVAEALQIVLDALRTQGPDEVLPIENRNEIAHLKRKQHELDIRRERLERAYLAGVIDLEALRRYRAEMDREERQIVEEARRIEGKYKHRQQVINAMLELSGVDVAVWLSEQPREANGVLRQILEAITVTKGEVRLKFNA